MFSVKRKNGNNCNYLLNVYAVRQTGEKLWFLFFNRENSSWYWEDSEEFIPMI